MSLLCALIAALDETERQTLESMALRGIEERIFHIHLHYRSRGLPSIEILCESLDVSQSHWYKTCAVLLQKSYRALCGGEARAVLPFLEHKHLYKLLYHELARQEKRLLQTDDRAALRDFYQTAYQVCNRADLTDYQRSRVSEYVEKFSQCRGRVEDGERELLLLQTLVPYIHQVRTALRRSRETRAIARELEQVRKAIADKRHPRVHLEYHKTAAYYEYFLAGAIADSAEHCRLALAILAKQPSRFSAADRLGVKRVQVEVYYASSQFMPALQLYKELYRDYFDELSPNIYHLAKFCELAMICDDYILAGELLDRHFSGYSPETQKAPWLTALRLRSLLALMQRNYDQAMHSIQTALDALPKDAFFTTQVLLRWMQTSCFLLRGDLPMAEMLTQRNLKFLYGKRPFPEFPLYSAYFRVTRAFIRQRESGRKLSRRLLGLLREFDKEFFAPYGRILRLSGGLHHSETSERQAENDPVPV